MKKGWFLLIGFLIFLGACKPENKNASHSPIVTQKTDIEYEFQKFDSLTQAKIDRFFQIKKSAGVFNGNILFYKSGKLYKNSYGVNNYIEKTPLNDSSIFQLASGSKPITAIAVMQLVEQGKVSLNDSVSKHIPNFPYSGITIEMLLSHRSGLSNYMYITDSLWLNQDIPICNDNMLDSFIVKNPDPYYPVNYKFNYCNTNYFLLAAIVEKVTAMEFGSWVQINVFDKLEMRNTQIYSDMDMRSIPNLAIGSENRRWHIPDYYLNGITGDKGVYSCTDDMLKIHLALQDGSILDYATSQNMYEPRSKFNYKNGSYGLGWRIVKERKDYPRIIYHLGWWRGYRSYFIRIPEEDIAIIVLSNLARGKFMSKEELINLIR
ncbi:MAG: serine hydrolase domain-containing protein [Salibacteraceae bacterium]